MDFGLVLQKYKKVVDIELNRLFTRKIREAEDSFLETSHSYLKEFVLRSGKRIRPIATIMSYEAVGGKNEDAIYSASIAPELYHASSLIHDDIMDEDLLRRSKPAMHIKLEKYFRKNLRDKVYDGYLFKSKSKRFSVSLAIMQGNILYSLANESIIKSKLNDSIKTKALNICNSSYISTNEGQMFDILMSSKEPANEKEYIRMAKCKTAVPIAASVKLGAVMANAKDEYIRNMEKYGICTGLAFQIKDDIIDLTKNKGRELGADIRKGNKTLMIINALKNSSRKRKLLKVLGNHKAKGREIKDAVRIIVESGSVEYSEKYAEKKIKEAKKHLEKAGLKNQGKKFFHDFADYVIKREK